jgi:hypothetical protein
MTVTVKHSKTNSITDWTQAQLDEQIALGNFAPGTTLANIVLPSDWNNDHTLTGVGTMAEQDATAVAITGGTINNTTIGSTTATTGKFTSVTTPSVTATTTDLTLSAISTGAVKFSTAGGLQAQFNNTASTVNYFDMYGSAATKAIQFKVAGSDTNISMAFQPKGTGAIDLAAGSSGVNISNGGTVTAITRTAVGSGYTTNPTVNITAPTTAGGVQAVLACTLGLGNSIAAGGTGYTAGDVLTVVGGTFTIAATFTVTTVASGVVTAITQTNQGAYTVAPTTPASTTGGTGTGFTANNNAVFINIPTITTAGSGYIEQPTITFSGGGGSGAAAFANVGGTARVTAISSVMELATSSGVGFRVANSGTTNVNFLSAQGNSSGGTAAIYGIGADADVSVGMGAKAAGAVRFFTNTSTEQMRVSNTTSAVNYVQMTGNSTGNPPIISAQGSDANITLSLASKSGGSIRFTSNGGANIQCRIVGTNAAVNNFTITGTTAGNAPTFGVEGTDADIDLALTPKGTGNVRFGTYTGTILTPTGYITIKDSGGTSRRLLVG